MRSSILYREHNTIIVQLSIIESRVLIKLNKVQKSVKNCNLNKDIDMHRKFINGMIVYTKLFKINDDRDNLIKNYMIVSVCVHLSE